MYCAAGFSEKNIDVVQYILKHQDVIHSSDALRP
jgi:cyclopropane-fatty-acyl-phospholipid synthase